MMHFIVVVLLLLYFLFSIQERKGGGDGGGADQTLVHTPPWLTIPSLGGYPDTLIFPLKQSLL